MKVSELMEELKKLPGDAPVLVSSADHSYKEAEFYAGTARWDINSNRSRPYYCEDHGDDAHLANERRIQALVEA